MVFFTVVIRTNANLFITIIKVANLITTRALSYLFRKFILRFISGYDEVYRVIHLLSLCFVVTDQADLTFVKTRLGSLRNHKQQIPLIKFLKPDEIITKVVKFYREVITFVIESLS